MPNHRPKFVGLESRTELWMSGDRAEPQNVDKRQTCTQAVKSCHFKSKFIKFDARTLHADLNKPNIHSPLPKLSKFALFNCVNLNDVELYAICVRRAEWLAGCQRCHILTDRKLPQKKKLSELNENLCWRCWCATGTIKRLILLAPNSTPSE